jgi:hypothetical protein
VKRGKKNGPRLLETPLLSPWLFADAAEEWGIAVAEAGHWNLLIVSSGREVPIECMCTISGVILGRK